MKGLLPASGHPLSASAANDPDKKTTQDVGQSTSQSTPASPETSEPGPGHQAMYGIVQDPEGTTNVREEPFARSKIVAELKNGERVEIDHMEAGWAHVILGPNKSGYIHKGRLNITSEKQ